MNGFEFAQKLKAKYPEYSDMPDQQLAEKVIAKYPEYSDVDLSVFSQPKPSGGSLSTLGNALSHPIETATKINNAIQPPPSTKPVPTFGEMVSQGVSAVKAIPSTVKGTSVGDLAKSTAKGGTSTVEGIGGLLSAVGLKSAGKTVTSFAQKVEDKYLKVKEDKNFLNQLAAAGGSAATFYGPGLGISTGVKALSFAPRLAVWLGIGSAATLEAGVNAGATYNEAKARGQSEEEARAAAGKTFVLNLPLNVVLDRWMFNKLPGGKRLTGTLKAASQEGTQEGVQQIIQNIALNDPALQDAGQAAVIGGLVGGGIAGGVAGTQALLEKKSTPAPTLAPANSPKITTQGSGQPAPFLNNSPKITPIIPTQETNQPESPLTETIAKTAQSIDQYIEDATIPVGLSVKEQKAKQINDDITLPKSINPEVELRRRKAKGIPQETILQRFARNVQEARESLRHYPKLNSKTDGENIEILRQQEAVPQYAKTAAKSVVEGFISGMGPKKYDVFTWNIIYPDMIKDYERGFKSLPFGYKGLDEVKRDFANYQKVAAENPDIQAALQKRREFMDLLKKELVDNKLLPEEVLKYPDYFHRQILEEMKLKDAFVGVSGGEDLRVKEKGYQRKRVDSPKDFNTEYIQAEFEIISQAISQLETIKTLNRLKQKNDIKAVVQKRAAEEGQAAAWTKFIPEGYTLWQPKEGSVFYPANSITDEALAEILGRNRQLQASDVQKVLALGQKLEQWVLPDRIAHTLDNFKEYTPDNALEKAAVKINSTWKQWVLLNPLRFIRYNLNNTSGDMDIAIAYDPKILKYVPAAAKDLWRYNISGKAPTPELLKAIRKGVVDSGLSINEIPDINKEGLFKGITGEKPGAIEKYWGNITGFTQWRENVLRLASYRYFQEKVATDKPVYAASKKEEIDALPDPDDKAAKLSRELVGDYGNISKAGQWLRANLIPFYSWIEINAPRYYRLLKNVANEVNADLKQGEVGSSEKAKAYGRLAGAGALKTGKGFAKLGLFAFLMYGLVNLWNRTMHPEEQKELGDKGRQLHIILGRNPETGEIITLRFQGALSDVLSWFGGEDFPSDIKDLASGDATLGDKAKEAGKAFANKAYGSLTPAKSFVEAALGKSGYPDIFNPTNIRDRAEYIAKTLSVEPVYRAVAGKPSKGIGKTIVDSVVYTSDPGEQAYFDTRKLVNKFLEKNDIETPSLEPTKKSNALYYYRKALVYGDKKAADKYMKQYFDLGGTPKGMNQSIKKMDPVSSIPKKYRAEFYAGLDKKEQERLSQAIKWYARIYLSRGKIGNDTGI